MSLEDFLKHCAPEYGSYRSNHRQGRAVHRVLGGDCRLAEDGESFFVLSNPSKTLKLFSFSSNRRQSRDQFTTMIHITSMMFMLTSMAAMEAA